MLYFQSFSLRLHSLVLIGSPYAYALFYEEMSACGLRSNVEHILHYKFRVINKRLKMALAFL